MTGPEGPSRFPVDTFPPRLALFCLAVAEHTQTPPELAGCAMLGALSTVALGGRVDAGGWMEELTLFMLVVMGPAQRKSSVMRAVLAPLEDLDRERRAELRDDVERVKTRLDALDRRKQQLLAAHAKQDDRQERDKLMGEIDEIDHETGQIQEPHHYRRLASDATPEVLGTLLSRHGRISVLASEAPFLDNLLGRYADGAPNLHLTCQAYEGEPTIIDRRRGVEEIPRPLLTIMLAVQEHHLPKLIEHPVAQSQGLVSRFLFVTPPSLVGRRQINTPPVPQDLANDWADVLRHVHTLLSTATGDGTDKTPDSEGSVGSVARRLKERERTLLFFSVSLLERERSSTRSGRCRSRSSATAASWRTSRRGRTGTPVGSRSSRRCFTWPAVTAPAR